MDENKLPGQAVSFLFLRCMVALAVFSGMEAASPQCRCCWASTILGWLSLELTSLELQSWKKLHAFELSGFILVFLRIRHCSSELDGHC